MKEKRRILLWSGSLLVTAVLLGMFFGKNVNAGSSSMYENLELFNNVFRNVRSYYYDVEKVKSKNLIYGAIKGMLQSLDDEHTTFMTPKEMRALHEDTRGQFGGLGIMIGIRDDKLTVISPLEGTPAWEKHLRAGDVITYIDGKTTKGISLRDAVSKLRGPVGSKVKITIMREGHDEPFDVEIIRAVIRINTVKSTFLKKDNIAYIKLTGFAKNTPRMLAQALDKMLKQHQPKALIIDLRNNPGGLLTAAIRVTDLFLSQGLIVYTKGRDRENDRYFFANEGSTRIPNKLPLAVLVNKGSASASEILSGALQDTRRGVLFGEKTFGKGSVQTIKPLRDGSAVKLTVALYYTPAGRQIHKKGLKPDVTIEVPSYSKEEQKAIFKLINEKHLTRFVRKHPRYTREQVTKLYEELKKKGISITRYELGRWLDWEKNKIGKPRIVNLKYDRQLLKTLEYIRAGKLTVRNIKTYRPGR